MPRLNVQSVVREALEDALQGVEVRVTVPNPLRAPLVVLAREGGAMDGIGVLDNPSIHVQMWAETEAEAADLAERVSDTILSLPLSSGVCAAREESLRSDPDPRTELARWFGSYTLTTIKYSE